VTLRTGHQSRWPQCIVAAAPISPALGYFPLWQCCHRIQLLSNYCLSRPPADSRRVMPAMQDWLNYKPEQRCCQMSSTSMNISHRKGGPAPSFIREPNLIPTATLSIVIQRRQLSEAAGGTATASTCFDTACRRPCCTRRKPLRTVVNKPSSSYSNWPSTSTT
jgi:hypothetical protein